MLKFWNKHQVRTNLRSVRYLVFFFLSTFFISCQHNLTHERHIRNDSSQTIEVVNPDYDTVFVISPGSSAMIYTYEILDTKQEKEDCFWMGDTLLITNEDDSTCDKLVTIEENWTWQVTGPEKERLQKCTFFVSDNDF